MKSYRALIASFIFCLAFSLSISTSHAQETLDNPFPDVIQDQLKFDVAPRVPAPYDNVIVTISDYSIDLDRSQINWTLNGKAQSAGIGNKSFVFQMGGKGEVFKVAVKIQPSKGPIIQKSITLIAQDVDIAWEANSYTAPFYKGKALHTTEGEVLFVAMPNFITSTGAQINPTTLIYKWSQDGTILADRSGYGKNTFSYTGTILSKPVTISVEVSTLKGDASARKSVTVTPENTKAVFYENNPLYGILFNQAVGDTFTLTAKEGKFEAFPYFFTGKNRSAPEMQYTWKLNDSPLLVAKSQHSMVFRNEEGKSGKSEVRVSVSNLSKILQNASAQLSIIYGSDAIKKFFEGQ